VALLGKKTKEIFLALRISFFDCKIFFVVFFEHKIYIFVSLGVLFFEQNKKENIFFWRFLCLYKVCVEDFFVFSKTKGAELCVS